MNARALIIEDRPEVAMLYEITLKEVNFDVSVAHSLREAYELLDKGELPDVVFLDLNLAVDETAAYTVTQIPKIKSYNPAMSVIVMSGFLTPEIATVAALQGASVVKNKAEMAQQVDLWKVLISVLESSTCDVKTRLEQTLTFLKTAANKLALVVL